MSTKTVYYSTYEYTLYNNNKYIMCARIDYIA